MASNLGILIEIWFNCYLIISFMRLSQPAESAITAFQWPWKTLYKLCGYVGNIPAITH
jgi:hypothetical protein